MNIPKTTEAAGSCFLETGLVYAAEGKSIVTVSAVRAIQIYPDVRIPHHQMRMSCRNQHLPYCWGDEHAFYQLFSLIFERYYGYIRVSFSPISTQMVHASSSGDLRMQFQGLIVGEDRLI